MSGRLQWSFLAGAVLVLILGAVFLPPFSVQERRLKIENFPKVALGMPLKEVEELLGGSPGNYALNPAETFEMTDEGSPHPPGTVEKLWFNENHMLEICFDSKDQVAALHKRAHFKQVPPETWWAKVWRSVWG